MKFGHTFKDSLNTGEFPARWVELAIPYRQLKKCLKKLRQELDEFGLDPETLRLLLQAGPNSEPTSELGITYTLLHDRGESKHLRPSLTADVRLRDSVAVDASLSAESRQLLERISSKKTDGPSILSGAVSTSDVAQTVTDDEQRVGAEAEAASASPTRDSRDGVEIEHVTVPLRFDAEFFDLLQGDVVELGTLHGEVQDAMTNEIIALGNEITTLSQPRQFSRTDMNRWRAIFELYLEAGVFFSTHEQDSGVRSSADALRQLQWFQVEVQKQALDRKFKLQGSHSALARFVEVNSTLVRYLQFQEMNQVAITKILKKFDKRTSLGISQVFPDAIQAQSTLVGNISKDLCSEISTRVVSLVPQITDYLCPICQELAYRTVRLHCEHVFCVRCVGKLLRRGTKDCPVCRRSVMRLVSVDNVDFDMEKFLKKYFPKEAREKNRANKLERGIEVYGEDFKALPDPCHLM